MSYFFEKVNPSHPDKVADRIAGAIVDYFTQLNKKNTVAVELVIGHGECNIIAEIGGCIDKGKFDEYKEKIRQIVNRITYFDKVEKININLVAQDKTLDANAYEGGCGDNGIFKGVPSNEDEQLFTKIMSDIYSIFNSDGKGILEIDDKGMHNITICQSYNFDLIDKESVCECLKCELDESDPLTEDLLDSCIFSIVEENYIRAKKNDDFGYVVINPLGMWKGGVNVDTGVVNRKLGSDMARAVTGGGLCLSEDSEYLAEDLKWYKIKDYKKGKIAQWNNGILEFVEPLKYIKNKEENFILFKNDTKISMCVTPKHELLLRTSKGNLIKYKAEYVAEKLKNSCNLGSFVLDFNYKSKSEKSKYLTEEDYRLQVAFCADGTLIKNKRGRIRVKKQYKKERLRELLRNKEYKEHKDGDFSIFYIDPPILSKSLYECFKNENWDILKEEIFKWDGDEKKRIFRTTKKEDADFIQFVLASYGEIIRININDRVGRIKNDKYVEKSILYSVSPYTSKTSRVRNSEKSKISVEYLKEKKPSFCFNVPSHNLLIRHNNKIFVTGNCGKDITKADVSINIFAHLLADERKKEVNIKCDIGDQVVYIDDKEYKYEEIKRVAENYIESLGGYESFATWGLVRPLTKN